MSAVNFLLGFVCVTLGFSSALPDRHLLKQRNVPTVFTDLKLREHITEIAAREIGVRELTGNNDGPRVEAYLACTGLKKGEPWCAAFLTWVFKQAGYNAPHSAWSPDLFPSSRLVKVPLPADVLGIYFPKLERIAHVGMVERVDGDWCMSIEGNTNVNGSREGDGVYRKRRPMKSVYRVADWFTTKYPGHAH